MTGALFLAIGLSTWLLRASFIAGASDPSWLDRHDWLHRLVPAAALSALAAGPLAGGAPVGGWTFALAALIAGAVAWRTRNMALTVLVGLLVVWSLS